MLLAALLCASALPGQLQPRKIGELDLTIGGISATVTPANPVIPKNLQGGVRIVVQSGGTTLSAEQVAQFLGGAFEVQGVYSGPGLPQAVDVTGSSDPLLVALPAVTESGDYMLSNLRLVVGGRAVLDVTPGAVPVEVIDQVLVTSVQTRALTLAEIQAKGIVLDSSDVLGFDFTIGLQLSSQVVNLTFPVVFDRQGVPIPQPLLPPAAPPRLEMDLPELPTIVPLLLKAADGAALPQVRLPNGAMADVRIPSVLVIPGNVGYLKQFFSAQLYVANGAPVGSNLSVHDVTGTILLPSGADHVPGNSDDPLTLPNTVRGPQPMTMKVLGLGPDGTPSVLSLDPGETGQAEFLIRGEKEGFHSVDFDIHATLEGLATGPVDITGKASGGVLVRNPYFDMSFTVPGVVRKGERFKVFATVTNISQALANNLSINLDAASTSGAQIEGSGSQSTPTLRPGDAQTFVFEFTSLRTGKVVASYKNFNTNDGSTGSLHFSLGVDSRGVPLSPDTLSLPAAVNALPGGVLEAAMRVLGQAWSVANAPAGTLPLGITRTSKTVVTQKALALAEAGLRQDLGQPLADALRDLATDFWGGSPLDAGFDQILRESDAGHDLATVLGAALADPMQASGGAVPYQGELSEVAASGPDLIAIAVGDGSGAAPVDVSITDGSGRALTSETPGGTIPGGVLLPLGSGAAPLLGLVTAPGAGPYTLLLTGRGAGTVDLAVTLPRGDGTFLRLTVAGVSVAPGDRLRLVLNADQYGSLAIDADGDGIFEATRTLSQEVVRSDGPRLLSANVIGPETLSQAGPFGFNMVLLFDRIVNAATARLKSNYTIPANAVQSAGPQLSGRLVFANLAQPEGPYVPASLSVKGIADLRGVTGPSRTVALGSRLTDPGAVVTGRVFNADGSPVGSAVVTYVGISYDPNCSNPDRSQVGLSATPLGSDGRYQFRYVRQDNCGSPFSVSTTDPGTGALRKVTSYVRNAGQQLVLDIALFGRGSVAGTVRDLSANPVPGALVVAVSGTDPQVSGQTSTDGDGRYTINGITVGPVNVSAAKGASLGHSAGRIDRAGSTATVDITLDGGSVKVHGTVQKIENGVVSPLPGAHVIYYLRDALGNRTPAGFTQSGADGSYALAGLPTGTYVLVAQINTRDRTEVSGVAAAGDDLTVPLVIPIDTNVGTVNGTVRLPNGDPAGGVLVSLLDLAVLTNADGTYQLPGVPVRPSTAQSIRAQSPDGLRSGQTTVIVNTANQVIDGANITLSGLGTAQFTVLDATGQPVAGQEVRLTAGFCNDACGCAIGTTDGQGRVSFPNLALGTVTGRAIRVGGSFVDLAVGTAALTTDGATGFGILRFPGSGTVKGQVVDAGDVPVLGADISLFSNTFDLDTCSLGQRLTQRVQTDVEGRFQFQRVNVGPVRVTASQAFFPTPVGAQGVLPKNGDTQTFNLKLVNTIAGVLSGTVFLPDGVTPAGAGVEVTANGPLPDVTVETDAAGRYKFAKIFPEGLYTLTASDPGTGGVFRTQVYLRAGQDAAVDLRLKGTGTVRVHVVDGAGNPVGSAFVKLQETEYPNETFDGALSPSDQGTLTFEEVFEGGLSVQVTDTFGRGGRASGVLPAGTAEVDLTVQLTTTGTVRGRFYRADGTTPIPLGLVRLIVDGRTIGQATTASGDDAGAFSFDYVPAGPVRLEAQDPLTARTGFAVGRIDQQDQVLDLDVIAQGIGTVQGQVTSDGDPQPAARVQIVSGTFSASTFTDSTGGYLVNGVPEGRVVVTADLGNGFLAGTNAATLAGDGATLTLDVALRGSGSVSGLVVQADGVTPGPVSAVTLEVGGTGGGTLSTTSGADGSFAFPRVPAGVGTLKACVLGDIDVGTATVNVPAGDAAEVTLRLNGTGGLAGLALDSAGQPVAGTVQLTGTGAFPYNFTLTAGSDGRFALPKVLAGPFTAQLRVANGSFTLFGSASGTIEPGETTELEVQVQPSGTVTGLVLRPDGETPAVGANVAIQLVPSGQITLQAQNDGRFTATGVPLGAFTVRINDPITAGLGLVQGLSITENGEVVDVGTITLNDNALTVLAVDPPDGAVNVDVHQGVTLTFSEPLRNTNGIFLTRGNLSVSAVPQLSADGRTVTLTGTWPDGATIAVNVTAQVADVFGRPIVQPLVTHFTTVDLTAPSVAGISPANQAIQVSPDSAVVVTFNEPLSTTASLANVVTLQATGGGAVEGSAALTSPNVVTFTPAAPLAGDTKYMVLVNGATDLAGNVQTAAFASSFATPDTVAPALVLNSPADGAIVKTPQPAISLTFSDALSGIDPTTAVLRLDGEAVAAAVSSSTLSFTPPAPLAEGSHAIAASVRDRAGNESTLAASFVVDTQAPGAAVLAGIAAGEVLRGQVAVAAAVVDESADIARIDFLIDGIKQAPFLPPNFSAPLDTTRLSDGSHLFTVQAVDVAGNVGPLSDPIQAFVDNRALTVTITSPAANAPFKGQVVVTAVASEPVTQITFSLGEQTVTATSSPYQGTLSLAGVADGPQTVTATAYDLVGGTATATRTIVVQQTPPPAPNATLIYAEPPNNGLSLVHGLPGAVRGGVLVTVTHTVTGAQATAVAAADGSFATSLAAAVDDRLSLTATDSVGNVSAATLVNVRRTPSLPPPSDSTSLHYEGNLVDRVGRTAGSLAPDGEMDAVFTLSLSIGNGITRQLSFIDLQGPGSQIRSTRSNLAPLGVAADAGAPLQNNAGGQISFPITSGATLTLFAGDGGFIQPGTTYTATAVFTDGARFVGRFTIVPPADHALVAHSATITASPATVVVNGATPGTATLTVTDIRDIDGTLVPDGAKIALSAVNMASHNPAGGSITSAGGTIVDGDPAPNNASFKVFTVENGTVTATYSSDPVTPSAILGALAVIQMQAADADGNVLGTEAVATLDLNLRAGTDRAIVAPVPSALYADRVDRRSHFTIQVRDAAGNPVPDGTSVLVSASSCASVTLTGSCIGSAGGQVLGGASSPTSSIYRWFKTQGGVVEGDYSSAGIATGFGQVQFANLQVVPADALGNRTSSVALGTAAIALAGGGGAEISIVPSSVPYVFPVVPVQVFVQHVHDVRAGIVPDGATFLLSVASCASVTSTGSCIGSSGGTITDGSPSPTSSIYRSYTLNGGQTTATYTAQGASAPGTGQVNIANLQLLMADAQGNRLDTRVVATAPLQLLGPGNAVGFAQPVHILADGALHTTTVTFTPVLDTFGNVIPDGTSVVASAANCAAVTAAGSCIGSVGGQILNGTTSPSGSAYKVLTVQDGQVTATYADQGLTATPGQLRTANVVLLPATANGAVLSFTAFGAVPVSIAGVTSGTGIASPGVVFADGGDQRTTVTLANFKDAAGQPVPDGTMIAVSAANCATVTPQGSCISSVGGQILGTSPAPFGSNYQLFTITNGQVVLQYSAQGVSVASGQRVATVQAIPVTPQGNAISFTALATAPIQLLAQGSAAVTAAPVDLFADGGDHRSQIVISGLLSSDGITPIPDGTKVGLTVGNCAAVTNTGSCISSAGGAILSAGTTPGDGTSSPSGSAYKLFTIAGGQVQAVYSDAGVVAGFNQTQTARVAVVPASNTGNILSFTSIGTGVLQLHGTTSATASGPATLSRTGSTTTGTVTFSGIKDSAGNTVPDGSFVAVATGNCATVNSSGSCNSSTGGTIVDGSASPSGSAYKVFTVANGSVSVTYSTAGASAGTARVQLLPAKSDGTVLGSTSLTGGVWAINVTN